MRSEITLVQDVLHIALPDASNSSKHDIEGLRSDVEQVIRENHYDAKGALKTYWIRTYDKAGNNIRKDIYLPNGELNGYMISTYDDAGKEQTFGEYKANDKEKFLLRFEYDCK